MKRVLLLVAVLLVVTASANAQYDHPKAEVWGSYSLFRADIDVLDNETLHGYGAGVQGNFTSYFGVAFEFTSNHGASGPVTIQVPGTLIVVPDLDTRINTFMGGPRFSYRPRAVTLFAHALFGGANSKLRDEKGSSGFSESNTEVAMAFGGGLDVNLGRHYAIRAAQVDYLMIHTDINRRLTGGGGVGTVSSSTSDWLHNIRYQAGFVFKF
jgi:opacity protein-like surface antigen